MRTAKRTLYFQTMTTISCIVGSPTVHMDSYKMLLKLIVDFLCGRTKYITNICK